MHCVCLYSASVNESCQRLWHYKRLSMSLVNDSCQRQEPATFWLLTTTLNNDSSQRLFPAMRENENDMTWHDVTRMTGRTNTVQRDARKHWYATRRDVTFHDVTWRDGITWYDVTWHDMTCHDITWHNRTRGWLLSTTRVSDCGHRRLSLIRVNGSWQRQEPKTHVTSMTWVNGSTRVTDSCQRLLSTTVAKGRCHARVNDWRRRQGSTAFVSTTRENEPTWHDKSERLLSTTPVNDSRQRHEVTWRDVTCCNLTPYEMAQHDLTFAIRSSLNSVLATSQSNSL